MTDQEKPQEPDTSKDIDKSKLSDAEELQALREKKIQERLENLRKRDPFIYR